MWNLLMYVLAVTIGLILFWTYEPRKEQKEEEDDPSCIGDEVDAGASPRRKTRRGNGKDFRVGSVFAALGLSWDKVQHFEAFREHFSSFEEVSRACRRAGLENSQLVIGVDFTASNEWQGRKSFGQNCLHKVAGNKIYNPYQKVIWILGQTLAPFDSDNMLPAYGFGDSDTCDEYVFPFKWNDAPCMGFQEVLEKYNEIVRRVTLAGPTSFAPVIEKAIELVEQTRCFHILVIVADGQVTEEKPTIDAIVKASHYPLSIIVVGVGDGPWDTMEEFDHRLPKRKFDNFRFVNYHSAVYKSKHPDAAFALQALMEIPDQYKTIKMLGYIEDDTVSTGSAASSSRHSDYGSPHCTPSASPLRRVNSGGHHPGLTGPRHGLYTSRSATPSPIQPRHRQTEGSISANTSPSQARHSTAV